MKISVLLLDKAKQIMLTPETDHERSALKMIAPGDNIKAVSRWGKFDNEEETYGLNVFECRGGYFRRELSDESLMFIVTDKKEAKANE